MPLPEDLKIVVTALLLLAVFTGIGLAVTLAVASALLQYRSGAALGRLRDFGTVEFLLGQKQYDVDWQMFRELKPDRLQWTLDEAALRRQLFRPGFAVWPLLAGLAAVAAAVPFALSNWPIWFPGSNVGVWAVLSLGGIAATAAPLVCWQGRRLIRSQQEAVCQAIMAGSPARWEKISTAAAPQLKALAAAGREVITALGETNGWRFTTGAPEYNSNGYLINRASNDGTLRLDYLAVAARYFTEYPRQRWRDDAARIRLALNTARRGLEKGKQTFPEAAACYWEAVAVGSEAEIVLKTYGHSFVEGGLQRYAMLMDQLFSGSFRTLLEEVACGADPAEYQRTVAAIKGELKELIAAAKARRLNKTAACLVLGVEPEAEAAEINRAGQSLLELWRPDEAAGGRYADLQQAYAFLKQHGAA